MASKEMQGIHILSQSHFLDERSVAIPRVGVLTMPVIAADVPCVQRLRSWWQHLQTKHMISIHYYTVQNGINSKQQQGSLL